MQFFRRIFLVALISFLLSENSPAQNATPSLRYSLLGESFILEDCPICGRPSIPHPLRGKFEVVTSSSNQTEVVRRLTNLNFQARSGSNLVFTVTGSGTWTISSQTNQRLALELNILDHAQNTNKVRSFTNEAASLSVPDPTLRLRLQQTEPNQFEFFSLGLTAAPLLEIWFSTASDFVSLPSSNILSDGDLLSDRGEVVRSNSELIQFLGLMPSPSVRPIDAIEVLPGGVIYFSFSQDVFSEDLGAISHGDMVSDRGRIVSRNTNLLSRFDPEMSGGEPGLDAIAYLANGTIWFSLASNVTSRSLNTTLKRGDLLSSTGGIALKFEELMARFQPATNRDHGLDAAYVWPNGEVWFSTEDSFVDQLHGQVSGGDLLSSAGYVVFRNADLAAGFNPDPSVDYGLDALFVATEVGQALTSPRLYSPVKTPDQEELMISWRGQGRFFQVEKKENLFEPFRPYSRLIPGTNFYDRAFLGTNRQSFYRIRQW